MKFSSRDLKIPFGKHVVTGRFHDAGSVPNGRDCNCVCVKCGGELQAVHPTKPKYQKYFRHDSENCGGGFETLFHKVAKQILKESNFVHISNADRFVYDSCDVEIAKYDKRPDAYISNDRQSLVVEIFFWHDTKAETLDVYLENGERVLKIDISAERKTVFNYERLKELVIHSAPRKLYEPGQPVVAEPSPYEMLKSWIPWIIGGGIAIYFFRKQIPRLFRRSKQLRKKRKRRR